MNHQRPPDTTKHHHFPLSRFRSPRQFVSMRLLPSMHLETASVSSIGRLCSCALTKSDRPYLATIPQRTSLQPLINDIIYFNSSSNPSPIHITTIHNPHLQSLCNSLYAASVASISSTSLELLGDLRYLLATEVF